MQVDVALMVREKIISRQKKAFDDTSIGSNRPFLPDICSALDITSGSFLRDTLLTSPKALLTVIIMILATFVAFLVTAGPDTHGTIIHLNSVK